jgi:tetratricopeptide (TPR) repeat protein
MRRLIAGTSLLMALLILPAQAADEAIDRLISKLPPPQKFVDPAVNDPLAKQITAASKAHNYGLALDLSRRLGSRYPKSLEAQMVHGILAMSVHQFREAMDAYHRALSIRPDFPPAYFGLGITNVSQNRFGAALSNFKQITRIAPQLEVGWIGSSVCAERLGRKQDSLEFARRATAVAPSSVGAWFQLAREENLAGNNQAAKAALLRANQLQRNAPKAKPAHR